MSKLVTAVGTCTLRIRVRYAECDAQQVVFNARYADYADLAATEYMRALIGDFKNLLASGYDNQVVSLNIDWKRSAAFDDVLDLVTSIAHIGNTSFRLLINMYSVTQNNELIAQAKVTYVVVDGESFEKVSIPALLLDNFKRKFDVFVNQSGLT